MLRGTAVDVDLAPDRNTLADLLHAIYKLQA